MFAKWLGLTMLFQVAIEWPAAYRGQEPRHIKYRKEIAAMAEIYEDTAAMGYLVDRKTDAALLAAVGYMEARYHLHPRAGDKGASVGPHQVSKGFPRWVVRWDPDLRDEWVGVKWRDLLDPETNVRASYTMLRYWERKCGSSDPGVWFYAYGTGRCPKGKPSQKWRSVGFGGKSRCKLAIRYMQALEEAEEALYRIPDGFVCAGIKVKSKKPRDDSGAAEE